MLETLGACPICKSEQREHFLRCKDYTVSGELFDIQECSNCAFRYTDPRPKEDQLGGYYESEDYISHSNKGKTPIHLIYKFVRQFTIRMKHQLVNRAAGEEPKKILDHGCGTGEFLAHCQKKGWECYGLEPDEGARQQAAQALGDRVAQPGTLWRLEDDAFTIVTLWHVLEHVPDLQGTVKELKRVLAPNGKLLIAVPNCSAPDAQHYEAYWAAYDVPRHLYHFRPPDIRRLFEEKEMKVTEVQPMRLDAIYASMLSEKYQGRSALKGIWNGIRSNWKADRSSENYSAQLYFIEHKHPS